MGDVIFMSPIFFYKKIFLIFGTKRSTWNNHIKLNFFCRNENGIKDSNRDTGIPPRMETG